MKCVQRNDVLFAITFNELIEYGLQHTTNIVNGMPWSFSLVTPFNTLRVTHENDSEYVVGTTRFNRGNVLVVVRDIDNYAYQIPMDIFINLFIKIGD